MKTTLRVVIAVSLALSTSAQGALLFQESFEGTGGYTVENGGFNPASTSQFFTHLPHGALSLGYTPGNIDGLGYFGGRDLNGFVTGTPHRVSFAAVDVSAYENISLSIALSARAGNIFEADDIIKLEYSTDGGTNFSQLDLFGGRTGGAALSNGVAVLNETLVDYSYVLGGTPGQLLFRISTDAFIAGNEAFAFDNFRVFGDALPIPSVVWEPASLALISAGLLSLKTIRKLTPKQT